MTRNAKRSAGASLEHFSETVTRRSGSTPAFLAALGVVAVWAALGPIFDYSDTWQLVINTGTTIVTFLMVFLIQRTQNKDALAIHIKLNELVAAVKGASNRVIDIEALNEADLQTLERHYEELARLSRAETNVTKSHSIEEARTRSTAKRRSLDES
jgi:low affinity Fe/Cu permease